MSKYYSVLEEHNDRRMWYHKNWTFNSKEEAEKFAKEFSEACNNRYTQIYEHDEPLLSESMEYLGSDTFGFAGLIKWRKGKDVTKEYKFYHC